MHIFSQKVYCGCCGKIFSRNVCHVKSGKQAYLQCKSKARTGGFICNNKRSIKYDELENIVLEQINNQLNKYYDKAKVEKNFFAMKVENEVEDNLTVLKKEKITLDSLINKKQKALTMLYDDRANGVITVSEFSLIKSQYSLDIDEYNKRMSKIEEEINNLEKTKSEKKKQEIVFKKYKKIETLTRVVIDEFIDKIYIGEVNPKTKKRKIRIEWNVHLD